MHAGFINHLMDDKNFIDILFIFFMNESERQKKKISIED
jgi:hypothetical protein